MKILPKILCLFIVLFSSCNEIDPKGEKEVREFVIKWNATHSQLKAPYLQNSYVDVVEYYGKERRKEQVQSDKLLLFEQFPDYTQSAVNDEFTITKEGVSYLVTFTKRVTYNGKEEDYNSYVSVIRKNDGFKIVREGVAKNSENLEAPIFPKFRDNNPAVNKNRRLYGDFNGDDLSDYAFVTSPDIQVSENKNESVVVECEGGCNSTINFSVGGLKAITIQGAYQSQLENLKDLNGDGADEIGFWNIKPASKSLYIYDVRNNNLLTQPIFINTAVHKDLKFIDVFKKTGPKKITVTQSVQENGKWVLESTVVVLE